MFQVYRDLCAVFFLDYFIEHTNILLVLGTINFDL